LGELESIKGLMRRQYQTPEGEDDLQAIEGIGPKIASLLRNADIKTFERLSETSLGELTRLLESGGPRFGLADPLTWAEQAALLFNGEFVAFEQLKEELIGGVRREAQAAPAAAVPAAAGSAGSRPAGDHPVDGPHDVTPDGSSASSAGGTPLSDGPLFDAAMAAPGEGGDGGEGDAGDAGGEGRGRQHDAAGAAAAGTAG